MRIKALDLNLSPYVYFFSEAEVFSFKIFKDFEAASEKRSLDFYELEAFSLMKSTEVYEADSIASTLIHNFSLCDENVRDILIMLFGQFYLNNFIDTDIKYKTSANINLNMKKFEEWKILRENFFYNLDKFIARSYEYLRNYTHADSAFWEKPNRWCHHNMYMFITECGKKYYDEILIPSLYNKYKHIEVDTDEEGNVTKWYGI
ncbi:hypothetical protein [uncultured Campylobacter sp.]|uniref:hypothetical protein n=1 Tax=uncultured Campylobacter sp. TaxID=218934 RepID=UPI00261EC157|nr:hypothetical protein [uncultured Campylobacter sp.]